MVRKIESKYGRTESKYYSAEDIERIHIAMHPTRLEILGRLAVNKAYASKLEDMIGIDRKIISFHLSSLERAGLLKSEFSLKNDPEVKPMAVKYYELTDIGKNVLDKIRNILTA